MTQTRGAPPVDYDDTSIFAAGDEVSPGVKEATFGGFRDWALAPVNAATPVSINEFYDASNGAAAQRMALEGAAATGRPVSWRGVLVMDQAPVIPARSMLLGAGSTSDNGMPGRTCLVRDFGGTGPLVVVNGDTVFRDIDFDGDAQGGGDNIQVIGERVILDNISSRKSGRHGVWIGDIDNDTLNANLWMLFALKSIYNAGSGLYVHHTNSDVGVTWPLGAANVNAGSVFGADLRSNGVHGVHVGNGVDNKFYGVCSQNNAASNSYFDDYARGNCFFSYYSEAGGDPDTFEATTSGNMIFGGSSVSPMPYVDNGTGNLVMRHDPSIKQQVFSSRVGVAGVFGSGVGGHLDLYDDDLNLAAQIFAETTGVGSRSKGVATAKEDGNVPVPVFEWDDVRGIDVLQGGVSVGGTPVLGARQAAIANAAGGDEVAKINAILAAMRAHGMIAP